MKINLDIHFSVEFPDMDFPEKGITGPVNFNFLSDNKKIGGFILAPMPGCCGVVVSTQSYLNIEARGIHRISDSFHTIKAKVAKTLGYSLMVATVQLVNLPEVIGAANNGWKFKESFRNTRTTNDIGLMVKKI